MVRRIQAHIEFEIWGGLSQKFYYYYIELLASIFKTKLFKMHKTWNRAYIQISINKSVYKLFHYVY